MTKQPLRLTAILLTALALCAVARAEAIRELVAVNDTVPIPIEGVGIVTGLAKTGDKSKASLEMLRKFLSENNQDFDTGDFSSGNVAVVSVSTEMPAFGRPGQRFPVTVTSIFDATDLTGGELKLCDLRTRRGHRYALASGRIVVGVGVKTGGSIPAGVNSGAMQLADYPFGGEVVDQEGWLRLNLNRANYADAVAIARQINQTPSLNPYVQESVMFAEAAPFRPVAFAKDAGQIMVKVPDQHKHDLSRYISQILDVPVAVDRPAKIVVNRSKNSIVVTGDVQVSNAVVSLEDKTVTIRPETEDEPAAYVLADDTPRRAIELQGPGTYADLQGLIDTLNAMGLTTAQIITIFEELRAAGAIRAEFEGM